MRIFCCREILAHFAATNLFFERKTEMNIPNDPAILLSYINTKLRDEYSNLDDLCGSLCNSREELEK
jgi:hypothetical protein